MTLLGLIISLIAIGVLLWLLNTYGAGFIDHKILMIINAVVIIAVILWLLTLFGLLPLADVPIPKVRS
jgi:hypothetical protein